MSESHDLLLYKARLAEQAERYEDMVEIMTKIAKNKVLKAEERNMFSVAYKNVIGSRRSSWRVVKNYSDKFSAATTDKYLKTIVEELDKICANVTKFLDDTLIPGAEEDESKVFYYKMKGDYCRYKAEYSPDDEDCIEQSKQSYKEAWEIADKSLTNTNPTKLGLALNYSVFYYEIKQDPNQACTIAKKAFDSAINELDQLQEAHYKDSTLIMQLLRDNLTLWTSDNDNADEEDGEAGQD